MVEAVHGPSAPPIDPTITMSETVKIGDRFRRPGVFLKVYRVVALHAYDRQLMLADLVLEGKPSDTLTLPVSTLLNDKQWRPVLGS